MTSDRTDNWQDCPTMKSVVEADDRGDYVECNNGTGWKEWLGDFWASDMEFRCRPAKPKTKTVVMREYLFKAPSGDYYYTWTSNDSIERKGFIRYTGNERTEEVPE